VRTATGTWGGADLAISLALGRTASRLNPELTNFTVRNADEVGRALADIAAAEAAAGRALARLLFGKRFRERLVHLLHDGLRRIFRKLERRVPEGGCACRRNRAPYGTGQVEVSDLTG